MSWVGVGDGKSYRKRLKRVGDRMVPSGTVGEAASF